MIFSLNWQKEYAIRDHLGNTRLMFTDKNGNNVIDITGTASTNDILQENHYYPFGMGFEGPWLMDDAGRDNPYLYNGKELESEFGLNWYAYGARWYDASIGRWNAVDPLADDPDNLSWSPFAYGWNNPIIVIDPTGAFNEYVGRVDDEGNVSYEYVSDEGGNETDYVTYTDSEGNEIGQATFDVEVEYTSGPGTDYTQDTDPTPGERKIHGKTPTVFVGLLAIFSGGTSGTTSNTLGFAQKVRRPKFRKGIVEKVWEMAKRKKGKVFDPDTGREIIWDKTKPRRGQWDMGHKEGKEWWRQVIDFLRGKKTRKQLRDEYNDPTNYKPELPSSNRRKNKKK